MKTQSSGITSIIAIVVMSVAMTTALGIYQLLFAEFLIARDQEHSIVAEYTAEAGKECALYNMFANEYNPQTNRMKNSVTGIECAGDDGSGDDYPLKNKGLSSDGFPLFEYKMSQVDACTYIEFRHQQLTIDGKPYLETIINSRGRYPCANSKVERGIQVILKQKLP